MPFVGLDWRSPGDQWIKTDSGNWEQLRLWRIKMFDHLNDSTMRRMIRSSLSASAGDAQSQAMGTADSLQSIRQPYAFVKRKTTRESLVTTSIGDVFARLDMDGGLKDLRRFRYITKIVYLLIADRLHQVSGRAQLLLVQLAKQAAEQALASKMYIGVARQLVDGLRQSLDEHRYEHIGSEELWRRHRDALDEMRLLLGDAENPSLTEASIGVNSPTDAPVDDTAVAVAASPFAANPFDAMPADCIRQVLRRLEDPADIERLAGLDRRLADLANEDQLWKRLVLFHFAGGAVGGGGGKSIGACRSLIGPAVTSVDDCNWPSVYRRLFRRCGDSQQFYPVSLHLCPRCSCLFWPNLGHPCNVVSCNTEFSQQAADPELQAGEQEAKPPKPISPEEFVRFFF